MGHNLTVNEMLTFSAHKSNIIQAKTTSRKRQSTNLAATPPEQEHFRRDIQSPKVPKPDPGHTTRVLSPIAQENTDYSPVQSIPNKRKHVIFELFDTERGYISFLRYLTKTAYVVSSGAQLFNMP